MPVNQVEHFFREKTEGEIPTEIFHDDKALQAFFLEYIQQPGWIENHIAESDQQHANAYKERLISKTLTAGISGIDFLYSLNKVPLQEMSVPELIQSGKAPFTSGFDFLHIPLDQMEDFLISPYLVDQDDRTPKPGTITDTLTLLEERLALDPQWAYSLPELTIADIDAWNEGPILAYIQALGLSEIYNQFSYQELQDLWKDALKTLFVTLKEQQEFHYACFLADLAIQEIKQAIPGWEKNVEKMRKKLILYFSKSGNQDDRYISSSFHHVIISKGSSFPSSKEFTAQLLASIHEITHACLREELFGDVPLSLSQSVEPPHLMGVLDEGVAITVEQALLRMHKIDVNQPELPSWATDRALSTLQVLQKREAQDLRKLGKLPHYTEGVRLARRLSKEGWRVEDIPQFAQEFQAFVLKYRGSDNPNEFLQISVSLDPKQEYMMLLKAFFATHSKK